jgi:hypothetical protein
MILVQLKEGGLLTYMDEAELIRTTGIIDNGVERTSWVEYRLKSDPDGRVVHRSVDMHLRTPMVWGLGEAQRF